REVPPPEPKFKNEKFTEQIVAGIDQETGNVLSLKTTLSGAGSVSTSTQSSLSRTITVGDFFGPWMLDVDDKYKRSAKSDRAVSNLETIGRKKVQGRDCFLVRKTWAFQDGPTVKMTYWVDVKSRFAVRIEEDGGRILELSNGRGSPCSTNSSATTGFPTSWVTARGSRSTGPLAPTRRPPAIASNGFCATASPARPSSMPSSRWQNSWLPCRIRRSSGSARSSSTTPLPTWWASTSRDNLCRC